MRRGPLLMIVAGLALAIMLALVKTARQYLDPLDVMFWRGAGALPLAALIGVLAGLFLGRSERASPAVWIVVLFGFYVQTTVGSTNWRSRMLSSASTRIPSTTITRADPMVRTWALRVCVAKS